MSETGDMVERQRALIDAIISAYHTTRLRETPASLHVVQKPMVQKAFAALAASGADRMREALKHFVADFENDFCVEGVIVDDPDPMLKMHYILARQALGEPQ